MRLVVVCRFWGGGLLLLSCNAKQLFGISSCGLPWQKICGGKGMDWDKKKWEEVWEEKRKLEKRTKNQEGIWNGSVSGRWWGWEENGLKKWKEKNWRVGEETERKGDAGTLKKPLRTSLKMLIKTLQWLGKLFKTYTLKKCFTFVSVCLLCFVFSFTLLVLFSVISFSCVPLVFFSVLYHLKLSHRVPIKVPVIFSV